MSTENPNPPTIGLGTTIELELKRLHEIECRYNELKAVLADVFTVRDQFAAAALPALIKDGCGSVVAKYAYEYADAMMAERAKK